MPTTDERGGSARGVVAASAGALPGEDADLGGTVGRPFARERLTYLDNLKTL